MDASATEIFNQHLIDPEICIRCGTCEATCPVDAVSHNDDNYVVDASICDTRGDCLAPCPTGAIDNWRKVARNKAYSIGEQFSWEELPEILAEERLTETGISFEAATAPEVELPAVVHQVPVEAAAFSSLQYNATLPPWSAAHAYTNLYGPQAEKQSISARVVGNSRVTEVGRDYDTHHIMLDFGSLPFPVLEGQSIGILPPGADARGRPHHARQYSIASPRNGERPGYNNVSLAIKRVLEDHDGNPVHGVASNYMCDLEVGDRVEVIGPFGSSFLMPNHPASSIVMICTGTGSAPMRAMTEWRRRLRASGKFEGGKLLLFFGARSPQELPYFGPLQRLPQDFIDINFAFSRIPDQPRRYVQDVMRERAADLAQLLQDPNAYFYACGLKAMEEGVVLALHDIAEQAGLSWDSIGADLKQQGRLHLETY
ncbi:MAG: benzoyl-CoA 2,3-epoxidase subunit BoxA [Gammaproteobacteria bacterium]|nr:benzoyl-CoA 2,3-epoxidase subunit BoxA [Gammaproteobacteria bacterium]